MSKKLLGFFFAGLFLDWRTKKIWISQKYIRGHFCDAEQLSHNRKIDWMASHIFYDVEVTLNINLVSTCTSFCWHNLRTKYKHRLHFWGETTEALLYSLLTSWTWVHPALRVCRSFLLVLLSVRSTSGWASSSFIFLSMRPFSLIKYLNRNVHKYFNRLFYSSTFLLNNK